MQVCGKEFQGPLDLEASGAKSGAAGVYIVVCECTPDQTRRMVVCNSSTSVGDDLANIDNQRFWRKAYNGLLSTFVLYADEALDPAAREALVQDIRERYHPWCNRDPMV